MESVLPVAVLLLSAVTLLLLLRELKHRETQKGAGELVNAMKQHKSALQPVSSYVERELEKLSGKRSFPSDITFLSDMDTTGSAAFRSAAMDWLKRATKSVLENIWSAQLKLSLEGGAAQWSAEKINETAKKIVSINDSDLRPKLSLVEQLYLDKALGRVVAAAGLKLISPKPGDDYTYRSKSGGKTIRVDKVYRRGLESLATGEIIDEPEIKELP